MVEAEEEDGGVVVLEMDTWLIVAGGEAVRVTMVAGMAIRGCVETAEGVEVAVLFCDEGTGGTLPLRKTRSFYVL